MDDDLGFRGSPLFLARLMGSDRGQALLSQTTPSWPERVEFWWQPAMAGKAFRAEATSHIADGARRAVTVRILGADGPWVNDYEEYRFTYYGRGLAPDAARAFWPHMGLLVIADHEDSPEIALAYFAISVVSVRWMKAYGVVWFEDHNGTPTGLEINPIAPRKKVTGRDRECVERGIRLLTHLPINMTSRGKPGSGRAERQRIEEARVRLTDAGHKALHAEYPPEALDRAELSVELSISTNGVAQMLRRAKWMLSDVRKSVNSVHAACSLTDLQ